jgi:hypothetical protein
MKSRQTSLFTAGFSATLNGKEDKDKDKTKLQSELGFAMNKVNANEMKAAAEHIASANQIVQKILSRSRSSNKKKKKQVTLLSLIFSTVPLEETLFFGISL